MLVSQGVPALREVIATAKGPGSTWVQRSSAFAVMAMFVDERGPQGLDAGLLAEIRGLAASALDDDPKFVIGAIDLSVLLGDADLRGKVERLAATPSSVEAFGINIRQHALAKLRDPTPYWYDSEWWTDLRLKRCVDGDSRESRVCRRLLADRR